MKTIILSVLAFLLTTSSLFSQMELKVRLDHRIDGKKFAYNQEATSPLGSKYKLTRLQYYLSGFVIVHDGGQELVLNDIYFLVDPSNPNYEELSLGFQTGITNVEKIKFAIGVDAASNHLDPASYPPGHPLAYQNPTMHWGWTSGYRFIALEGKAARANNQFIDNIAIHTVGDVNYLVNSYDVQSKVDNGIMYIEMKAEYNMILDEIIIAGGQVNHSETGSAAVQCFNATTKVFSASSATSTNEVYNNNLSNVVYQQNQIEIHYDLSASGKLVFNLYNSFGQLVEEKKLNSTTGKINVNESISSGHYYYLITDQGKPATSGKILVK